MTQLPLPLNAPTDICRRKHGGNRRSEQANERANPHKVNMRERIRVFVTACEANGATLHELCRYMGKLPHQISGRITELKQKFVLFDSGRERGGAAVLVANRNWCQGSYKG